ncbi:L-lactate permease [Nisaea acidiphila]|uniref:L-lactate permease n=1 Tax=Nisaea acidiphila TaxID=1862145 RepID=A0A9J7ATI5_9PROT|nr:L-lactate permease [Nisaea acidiphila]UUX50607.1 L-lactate permease [Nisaea acidiphila]
MPTLLASAPLVLATLAILLARQSAMRAGGIGLATAILIAALAPDFTLSAEGILTAVTDGLLTTATVAYVLLGGVTLYWVLRTGGALDRLGRAAAEAIPDPAERVLVLVLGVSVFFESATGFGVGIIVTVPLLIALGYSPVRAALMALLGQCAVPWGALAIGTVLGAELSDLSAAATAMKAVWLSLPFILLCAFAALRFADESIFRPRHILAAAFYSALLAALLWMGSAWISVELAGCIAGLGVTLAGLALARIRTRARAETSGLAAAALPLAVLMGALSLTRLVPEIGGVTASVLRIEFPSFEFSLSLVHHPGFWMLCAAATGILSLRIPSSEVRILLPSALRQWLTASLSVAGFICFGHVMLHSGMTDRLAETVATSAGAAYLFAVPAIGGLGGFLTASNAGSNAIFMAFQSTVANRLALDPVAVAAAQNASGANITMASPGRIVLAASVSGLTGEENRLMRPALAIGLAGLLMMLPVLALL